MSNPKPKPGPGRPKGLLNKSTRVERELFQNILADGAEKFVKEHNSLTGKEYCDVWLKTAEFAAPKPARVEPIEDKQRIIQVILPSEIKPKV